MEYPHTLRVPVLLELKFKGRILKGQYSKYQPCSKCGREPEEVALYHKVIYEGTMSYKARAVSQYLCEDCARNATSSENGDPDVSPSTTTSST